MRLEIFFFKEKFGKGIETSACILVFARLSSIPNISEGGGVMCVRQTCKIKRDWEESLGFLWRGEGRVADEDLFKVF